MDIRSSDIEMIVKQVLESLGGNSAPARSAAAVPATSRVAMLTQKIGRAHV